MIRLDYRKLRAIYKGDNPKIIFKVVQEEDSYKLHWVAEEDEELVYAFYIPFIDDDWIIYSKE